MSKSERPLNQPNQEKAFPAPLQRDLLWAQAALDGEIEKLATLSDDENINKADSAFFASLVKIAAVVKGSGREHLGPNVVLEAIKDACSSYPWLKEREIERQWKNAYNYADPRYRRD